MKTLQKIASHIKTGGEFMDSIWQNAETETVALSSLTGAANNQKAHGENFSWLHNSATQTWKSAKGLDRLITEGYLVKDTYTGPLTPPEGTILNEDGTPLVIRVTQKLLDYAAMKFGI